VGTTKSKAFLNQLLGSNTVRNELKLSGTLAPQPYTIRTGMPSDASQLAEHWGSGLIANQIEVICRYFGDVDSGDQYSIVAVIDTRVIGQIWVRLKQMDPNIADAETDCYLHTLFVLEEYRRQGVGKELVGMACEYGKLEGRTSAIIGVDRPNKYAKELYEKWGFEQFSEICDLRGDLIFLRRLVAAIPSNV